MRGAMLSRLILVLVLVVAVVLTVRSLRGCRADGPVEGDQPPAVAQADEPGTREPEAEEPVKVIEVAAPEAPADKEPPEEETPPGEEKTEAEPSAEKQAEPDDAEKPAVDPPEAPAAEELPAAPEDVEKAFEQAKKMLELKNRWEARRPLTTVYRFGAPEQRAEAKKLLDEINAALIFTPSETEGAVIHKVKKGENLTTIARKNGVYVQHIKRINKLQRDLIRPNQLLKIIPGQPSIEVDKSSLTLTLYLDGVYVKEYSVGTGKQDGTPEGEFIIERMVRNPDWYPPEGGVVKFGSPEHEIGTRWMGFKEKPGLRSYGIHGTNDPATIGKESTRGCVRLRNEDVEELYDLVREGTPVKIYKRANAGGD